MEECFQFIEGQIFDNYESVNKHFHNFCENSYQPFVVRSRSNKQIIYKCCHGIERKSKCRGERPNQHYFFKGCTAQINFYKNKENKWKVTKVSLDHNHNISKEEYYSHRRNIKNKENKWKVTTVSLDHIRSISDEEYKIYQRNAKFKEDSFDPVTVVKVESQTDSDLNVDEELETLDGCKNNENETQRSLTDTEKYELAFDTIKNLADILSNHSMPSFLNYIQELKIIENNARLGLSLFDPSNIYEQLNKHQNQTETKNIDLSYPVEHSAQLKKEVENECSSLMDTYETKVNLKSKIKIKSKVHPITKRK